VRLIGDNAYESDSLDAPLARQGTGQGIELTAPHHRTGTHTADCAVVIAGSSTLSCDRIFGVFETPSATGSSVPLEPIFRTSASQHDVLGRAIATEVVKNNLRPVHP
jgi:hypothetical protein